MSPREKKMGVGAVEAANPKFQVAREKREGQGEEGGQSRRYKRCSVFSGKRARDEGWRAEGAQCLT